MEYEWEKKINQSTIAKMKRLLPDGFDLAGIAVVNKNTCEAALMYSAWNLPTGDVASIDIWQDIEADASEIHQECLSISRDDWQRP